MPYVHSARFEPEALIFRWLLSPVELLTGNLVHCTADTNKHVTPSQFAVALLRWVTTTAVMVTGNNRNVTGHSC